MPVKFFIAMILSILMLVSTASAEDYYRDYDWVCDYAFPATPLVHCVDNKGKFEHNIYYFAAGNNKCLVVLCHGFGNNSGFGIQMHGRFRPDYANAVAESLAYWTRQGKLNNIGDFNYVFMNACYTGYAQSSVTLPIYNISLVRAIDYKGVTGFSEEPYQNNQVLIKLYRVIPKNSRAARSSSALSDFLKNNNVRGYRSIGSRSSTRPKGVIILSEQP